MAQPTQPQTLQKKPGTHSLIISVIIGVIVFFALLLILEGTSRTAWLDRIFPLRSLGIYHSQFEIKWFKLQDYARQNDGVDVILLGNSMVNTGIDPDVLASEYEKQTGVRLRIFNFGVEGLTVAPNSIVAKILVEKYHPASLLFVTEMRDYVAANGLEVETQLLTDEWFTAQSSSPATLRSWLKLNSSAAEHLLPFRNWSRADFPDTFLSYLRRYGDTTAAGYEPDRNVGKDIDKHPDPNDPAEAANFAMFKDFSISLQRLQDLKTILELGSSEQPVIVTEMPLYPTYFDYFGGEEDHQRYLSSLEAFVNKNGGDFLPPLDWTLIPLAYRVDHHHLNLEGAPLYSTLLAQQLARNCETTAICLQPVDNVDMVGGGR